MLHPATDEGALVSLNGGEQWEPLTQGLRPNPVVYSMAVSPNDPLRVSAVTADGMFQLIMAEAASDTSPGAQAPHLLSRC